MTPAFPARQYRAVTMTSQRRPPVTDWATDFDHTDPEYAARAPEIWAELRDHLPGRALRALRRHVAADAPRRCVGHCARHRALHQRRGHRHRAPADAVAPDGLCAADHVGSTVPPDGPTVAVAAVRAEAGEGSRAVHPGLLPPAGRRSRGRGGRHRRRRRCCGGLCAEHPGADHRPHAGHPRVRRRPVPWVHPSDHRGSRRRTRPRLRGHARSLPRAPRSMRIAPTGAAAATAT